MIKIEEQNGFWGVTEIPTAMVQFLNKKYSNASPFPHIVLDNFFPDDFLNQVLKYFPEKETASVSHKSKTQFLKRGYRPQDLKGNPCAHYLSVLNSVPILQFLESLTGITHLVPDPYYAGGGLHETETGGHLDVHVDFTWHKQLNLARRLNMIIFLNKNWKSEYGGNLELWDTEMNGKVVEVEPIYNRCVIFSTTDNSYHGQPGAVNCPPSMTRRSIALYYYTNEKHVNQVTSKTMWKSKIEEKKSSRGINIFKSLLKK